MFWNGLAFDHWGRLLPFDYNTNKEECGVITGLVYPHAIAIIESIKVPNRAINPYENFLIRTSDVPETNGLVKTVGVVHTHPDPRRGDISRDDVDKLKGKPLFGLMFHPYTGKLTIYTGKGWIDNVYLERTDDSERHEQAWRARVVPVPAPRAP